MKSNKPQLEEEKEYSVRVYPASDIRRSMYVGLLEKSETHVFANEKFREFLLLKDSLITEKDGVITYSSISSEPVRVERDIGSLSGELGAEFRSKLFRFLAVRAAFK